MSTNDVEYFWYLKSRSRIAYLYRWLWLYPRLSLYLYGKTLDIGCGIGDMLAFKKNTIGVDINPMCVDYCVKKGLIAKRMELGILPFNDYEFDSILLDNVLEHIESPVSFLIEIRRVMKKNASIVVGVPGLKGWDSDSDHKIHYNEYDLETVMKNAGFGYQKNFATPFIKSDFLSKTFRQYCIYGVFKKI